MTTQLWQVVRRLRANHPPIIASHRKFGDTLQPMRFVLNDRPNSPAVDRNRAHRHSHSGVGSILAQRGEGRGFPAAFLSGDGRLGSANAPGRFHLRQVCRFLSANQRRDQREFLVDCVVFLPESRITREPLPQVHQFRRTGTFLNSLSFRHERTLWQLSRLQ